MKKHIYLHTTGHFCFTQRRHARNALIIRGNRYQSLRLCGVAWKMSSSVIYLLFLIPLFSSVNAQQSSKITQAAEEFGIDNPAGISIEEIRYRGATVSAHLRNQWWRLNTPGFPQSQTLTWLDNTSESHQIGAVLLADKIGETRQTGAMGRYAHTLGSGLKIGVSAGISSHRIFTENLDRYDEDDPLTTSAGDARWRYSAGAGLFYARYEAVLTFKWFAGLSFRQTAFLSALPDNSTPPAERDLLAQGGIGWASWWATGRLRISSHGPGALDLYLRKYLADGKQNNFFLGGIASSDGNYQTAGGQIGFERLIKKGGLWDNHYLAICLGISKPLSKYIQSGNLVFDARMTWSWQRKLK
jgi:hypothetical protein